MNILRGLARPLLASYFIYNGIDAIRRSDVHAAKLQRTLAAVESVGVPPVLTADAKIAAKVSGAVAVGAGAGLALGIYPRTNAIVLAGLTIPVAILNNPLSADKHDPTADNSWRATLESAAVMGGLLLAISDRDGRPSLRWRWQNFLDRRARINEVRATERERLRD